MCVCVVYMLIVHVNVYMHVMCTPLDSDMAAQASVFRIALVQLAVGADKATNLSRATEKVREASKNGANVVALPVSLRAFTFCRVTCPAPSYITQRSVLTVRMGVITSRSMQSQCPQRMDSLGLRLEILAGHSHRLLENVASS